MLQVLEGTQPLTMELADRILGAVNFSFNDLINLHMHRTSQQT